MKHLSLSSLSTPFALNKDTYCFALRSLEVSRAEAQRAHVEVLAIQHFSSAISSFAAFDFAYWAYCNRKAGKTHTEPCTFSLFTVHRARRRRGR